MHEDAGSQKGDDNLNHSFDPSHRSILLPGKAEGGLEGTDVLWLFDTGATETAMDPEFIRLIGGERMEGSENFVETASSRIRLPLFRIGRIEASGISRKNFPVRSLDMYQRLNIGGILGMDFLADMKMTIDFPNGTIKILKPTVKRTTKRKR